jgi:tetratricopeptide (TPR) repeat protein
MIMRFLFFAIAIISPLTLGAQSERQYMRQGNSEYNRGQYEEAEVLYRRANDKNNRLPETSFNIGAALYKQEKYDEAARQITNNIAMTEDNSKKAAGLYNLGNSYLQADKFKESIEAYKESLRLQPNNFEAKYNLAYAQDRLKQQEEEQQDRQNQDNNNQDNEDNQQDDQNQQTGEQNQSQSQQDEQSISMEDAEQLLNSLANDEQKVLEWMLRVKAERERRNVVKNW